MNSSTGVISGTPTTAGTYSVTITAADNAGFEATASFTWTVTNTVSVTNPGDQNDVSGSAITPLPIGASDSSSTATLTYSAGSSLPPGLSIDPSSGVITGTPTMAGTFPVTVTATDNAGFAGIDHVHLDHHQHGVGDQPRRPERRLWLGHHPAADPASDSLEAATLSYSDNGTLPAGLSIDPSSGSSRAHRRRPGAR